MKKIRILTTITGGVNFTAGWEGEVDDAIADDLLRAGHAEPFDTKPKPPAEGTLKIRLSVSVASANYSYAAGYEGYVPEAIARDLVQAGHAEWSGAKPSDLSEKAVSAAAKNAEKR